MKNILLVEDSKEIHQLVNQATAGLANMQWASTIKEAQEAIKSSKFDLILLDIELPDGSGVDLCHQIQASSPQQLVFFLTSHDDLSEKVLGFAAGGDDYITKPFNPLELRARIEANFRKIDLLSDTSNLLRWPEMEIDKMSQSVKVLNQGQWADIELTALEFKLLMYFAQRPNQVLSRDTILDSIWGESVHVYSRSVDTHVSKLRKKMLDQSDLIQSVHGAGYKFTPTV